MIKDTNHSVTDAMEKLQEKTKEVEEIAGSIMQSPVRPIFWH